MAAPKQSDTPLDLILVTARLTERSWDTGFFLTAGEVIDDNRDAWIGDLRVDASAVPDALLEQSNDTALLPGASNICRSRSCVRSTVIHRPQCKEEPFSDNGVLGWEVKCRQCCFSEAQ